MPYKHLTIKEREKIYLLSGKGLPVREISRLLQRQPSTISRELKRNTIYRASYSPHAAQIRAKRERKTSRLGKLKILASPKLHNYVLEKLELGWSPEQIAGRVKLDLSISIVPETIYQYIYSYWGRKSNLRQYLRRSHAVRRPRSTPRKTQNRGKIPNRIDISLRPKSVESRKAVGHWEGDTIVGKRHQSAIVTLVERKSRYLEAQQLGSREAEETKEAIIKLLKKLPIKLRKTITFDNGKEFTEHEQITKRVKAKCYFATPYKACERGTNEHTNGQVRWYLPKGTDFNELDPNILPAMIEILNDRPRKCLDYQTPKEVLDQELKQLKCCTSD
jgi:transposase, IS30 family